MSLASIFAFAFLFVGAVTGEFPANCPAVVPFPNLESSRLSGEWIGVQYLNPNIATPEIKCLKVSVQVDAAGIFKTNAHLITAADNEKVTYNAIGTPIDGVRSKLSLTKHTANQAEKVEITTILDTDYDHYVIWVTCKTKDGKHGLHVLVMSRQNALTSELLNKVEKSLKGANIIGELVPLQQTNC